MFKKSSRQNFRRQRRSSDDDHDHEADENGMRTDDAKNGAQNATPVVAPVAVNKVKVRTPSPPPVKTANLLSFDAVEEGDDAVEFKIKKSSESRRLDKFQRRVKKEKKDGSVEAVEGATTTNMKREIPSPSPTGRSKSPIAKVVFDDNVNEEKDDETRSNDLTSSKFRSLFSGGAIPDAQAVYRARKQREKARVEGDSFIPLEDDTQRLKDKSEVRSRLVREDENDVSDEEDGGQFYSARSLVITDEERRRNEQAEFLAVEQGESDDDSDDELARWEQEQIRKGISAQQISAYQHEQNASATFYGRTVVEMTMPENEAREPEPMEIEMEMDIVEARKLPKQGGGPSTMVSKAPIVAIGDIIASLRIRLAEGEQNLKSREFEKEKLATNLAENSAMIANLEMSAPRLQQQYTLYQEMRVYSRNLLECLDETIGKIDELEDGMMALLKNRMDYLIRRRRQDVRDQYDECSAAAAGKAQSVVRTPDVALRAAEREGRRGRRRQAREKQLAGVSHHEGMSSDDEETLSQVATFKETRAQLVENAKQVFTDALEEYSSIEAICERLMHWLSVDAPSFEDAFIAVCIPKLLSPIIRLQLIDWNPLTEEVVPLETMEWYLSLLAVGSHSLDVDKEHPAIVGLIPAVIEKVILPKLTSIVSDWWDPCSLRQSRNLSALLVNLVDSYPTLTAHSKTVAALLTAVSQKAKAAVDDDLFMPVYQKEAIENSATGARAFLDRQFWSAIKVIKGLLSFEGFLSSEAVQELVVDGVINRNIVLGLQCSSFGEQGTVVKCRAVFNTFPAKWFKSKDLSKQLESLCKVVERIAEQQRKNGSRDVAKDLMKFVERIRNTRDRTDRV